MTTRTETRIDEIATLIQLWRQTDESSHELAQRIFALVEKTERPNVLHTSVLQTSVINRPEKDLHAQRDRLS